MYEGGVSVTIGGREYKMVFTLAALLAVKNRYGGLQEMAEAFGGPAINEWDSEEEKEQKSIAGQKAQEDAIEQLPWLIATLINQGELLADPKAEEIPPEYIALRILPRDVERLMNHVMEAIAIGMGTEHEEEEVKRDLVLEELDIKNAKGAKAK